ncbi:39S ribosomal protein L52, mitochondrial [Venturia canescens]|uniref:39S ribosomal protein L52, mitochondrial n=1 Tax=Venturia canescens TaxID=32260 RepID=UPI001C9D01DE|nr:39S ribosomal protein L52, mitochondrial [Venturia canescens]
MLLKQMLLPTQSRIGITTLQTGSFHKSATVFLDDRWRAKNRLTKNPNASGPLTNYADYSFKDGRPAPFGVKQMIRMNKQREFFAKIKEYSQDMDETVERHKLMEEEKARERQKILDSKLKPKGYKM